MYRIFQYVFIFSLKPFIYISEQAMHIRRYRELDWGVFGRASSKPERISPVQADLGDIVDSGPEHRKKASCNIFPCVESLAFN